MDDRAGRVLVLGLALGVLVLLAIGAGAGRPAAALPGVVRIWPLVALAIGGILVVPIIVVALRNLPVFEFEGDTGSRGGGLGSVVLLLALVIGLQAFPADPSQDAVDPASGGQAQLEDGDGEDGEGAEVDVRLAPSAIAAGLAALLALGLVAAAGGRRGRSTTDADGELVATVARMAADEARAVQEPRAAVVAAFAAFEDAFAERGLPRNPTETQAAWVERVLLAHGAPATPAARLRHRFEAARWSTAVITADDRAAALADLAALLDARATS